MVRKLFWEDPYQTQCQCKVTAKYGDVVRVDQSIAYAFSGGQESDYGTIGGYQILDANKRGLDIEYTLEPNDLEVGDEVEMKIDFDRRYKLMKNHFLGDLILLIIRNRIDEGERIGAHVSEEHSRIDLAIDFNISTLFDHILEEVNRIKEGGYEIETGYTDVATQIRYWQIEGYKGRCGGTHIKNTNELGNITLKRKNLGKNKERIIMATD